MTRQKLKIEGITKTFGAVTALHGADLEMAEGEFLTLLGPSGSGKTTLLSIIAGLMRPTSGQVWIDGRLATDLPSFKRDLGMVFQNYALFPHLSVFENVAFPLRMRRRPGAEVDREVARVLDIVKLPHVAGRLPRELSGGQQQRIALARCIVYRPSIVLMDEPLGALDKKLREHMQMEIKRLHGELGITILYVTHDQEEALAMSDRICLMNNARIEQIGTPDDLYFRPRSVFAADFLGESNIFSGVLVATGSHATLRYGNGRTLFAEAPDGLAVGRALKWMVRPESLRIVRGDSGLPNRVGGLVQDIVFAGDVTKIHVRTDEGDIVVAKELTAQAALPGRGEAIMLGWRSEDTVLLPEDASS
jgi:putative spermidine/putrescine transport system ATP-binding protein